MNEQFSKIADLSHRATQTTTGFFQKIDASRVMVLGAATAMTAYAKSIVVASEAMRTNIEMTKALMGAQADLALKSTGALGTTARGEAMLGGYMSMTGYKPEQIAAFKESAAKIMASGWGQNLAQFGINNEQDLLKQLASGNVTESSDLGRALKAAMAGSGERLAMFAPNAKAEMADKVRAEYTSQGKYNVSQEMIDAEVNRRLALQSAEQLGGSKVVSDTTDPNSIHNRWMRLLDQFQKFQEASAGLLEGGMGALMDGVTKLFKVLADNPALAQFVVAIVGLGVAVMALGGPLGLIIGLAMILESKFQLLSKTWDYFANTSIGQGIIDKVKKLGEYLGLTGGSEGEESDFMKDLRNIAKAIYPVLLTIKEKTFAFITWLENIYNALKEFVGGLWDKMPDSIKNLNWSEFVKSLSWSSFIGMFDWSFMDPFKAKIKDFTDFITPWLEKFGIVGGSSSGGSSSSPAAVAAREKMHDLSHVSIGEDDFSYNFETGELTRNGEVMTPELLAKYKDAQQALKIFEERKAQYDEAAAAEAAAPAVNPALPPLEQGENPVFPPGQSPFGSTSAYDNLKDEFFSWLGIGPDNPFWSRINEWLLGEVDPNEPTGFEQLKTSFSNSWLGKLLGAGAGGSETSASTAEVVAAEEPVPEKTPKVYRKGGPSSTLTLTPTAYEQRVANPDAYPGFNPAEWTAEFALGTDYIPRTGLAILHKGEAVVPASQNLGRSGNGPLIGSLTVNAQGDANSIAREVKAALERELDDFSFKMRVEEAYRRANRAYIS